MSQTATEYAYQTAEGGWRITNSRVSLDSVVHAYWEGKSPEAIAEDFSTLTSEQVYGAIAFYLHNKPEIDQYLCRQDARWTQMAAASESRNGPLLTRLRNVRSANQAE
jgi:uncharacterized protein (DUF433 family)